MMANAPSWIRREGLALHTDLYELTMAAGYLKEKRPSLNVCFEYFFRSLPPHAGFAVAAGLEPFLDYLENLRFDESDIDYLRSQNIFDEEFFDFLAEFTPSCTVRAVPEGTLVFPHEPIVQIEGPIIEAQLIETALLNMLNYQTLIATKAARVCLAAEYEPVFEFGLRRAHGPDGGLSGARAAYIGGCSGTSNTLAGKVYGIPVSGTHAHSWVMSFDSELDAFRAFARNYPERCVLLVDTYDTLGSGVPNAIQVFREMRDAGHKVRPAIRLDSGDLAKLSKAAYRMMTDAGFDSPLIVASNDLDEQLISALKRQQAKINAWGVGTSLITSKDHPALSGVYKLVAIEEKGQWVPRMKTTANVEKSTDPGRKQVMRFFNDADQPIGDMLCSIGEDVPKQGTIEGYHRTQQRVRKRIRGAAYARPLLSEVIEHGKRCVPRADLAACRQRALDQIVSLPDEFVRLMNPERYRVMLSPTIADMKEELVENPDQW